MLDDSSLAVFTDTARVVGPLYWEKHTPPPPAGMAGGLSGGLIELPMLRRLSAREFCLPPPSLGWRRVPNHVLLEMRRQGAGHFAAFDQPKLFNESCGRGLQGHCEVSDLAVVSTPALVLPAHHSETKGSKTLMITT